MANREKSEAEYLAEEMAVLQATELVVKAMERTGLSRSELAERLGVSPSEITQRLRGTRNLTIRTLAGMLFHMDHELVIQADCTNPEEHTRSVRYIMEAQYRTPAHSLSYQLPGEPAIKVS